MKKAFIILLGVVAVLAANLSVKAQEATIATTPVKGDVLRTQISFITDGNWNDGGNWSTGVVPAPGSDVVIMANVVIPAGYIAVVNEVSLEGGSITVANGGQLMHNTNGLVVTMQKNIEPYSVAEGTDNYYLLSFPFNEDVAVPDAMTAVEGCDFYEFDGNYQDAEWRNNRLDAIDTVSGTTGYLYAALDAIELSLTGSTCPSYYEEVITVTVPYVDGSTNLSNGWALLGNPFTCNAYIFCYNSNNELVPMDFMVYNSDGEMETLSGGPIAPMQGFFVKVTATTTVYIKNHACPMGAINGKFTINNNGDQIYFSQGNLQYIGSATTPYWKFADNQWEVLGVTTGQNSDAHNVDRDLFGWGTSGWDSGNPYHNPWDTNNQTGASYGPIGSHNFTGTCVNSDWGVYNPISNGGNMPEQWRTLSKEEWGYVFNTRTTATGIRFAKANVNNVNGVILLPDDWDTSYYELNDVNAIDVICSSNTITAAEWVTLEQYGAVFLPATGFRFGVSVNKVGVNGYYWSSSYVNSNYAYGVYINDSNLIPQDVNNRSYGRGVRLVHVVE